MVTKRETFLKDIIITAVESSSIDYWAEIKDYEPDKGDVLVREWETTAWKLVNMHTVELGIYNIKQASFQVNSQILGWILMDDRNNEFVEMDSTAVDVIIQAALLGELVYG